MISVYGKTGDFVNIPSLKIPKKDGFFVSWEIAPFDLAVELSLKFVKNLDTAAFGSANLPLF